MFTQRAFLVRERERVEQAGLPAALVELVQLVVPLMPAGTVNTEHRCSGAVLVRATPPARNGEEVVAKLSY